MKVKRWSSATEPIGAVRPEAYESLTGIPVRPYPDENGWVCQAVLMNASRTGTLGGSRVPAVYAVADQFAAQADREVSCFRNVLNTPSFMG